MQNDIAASGKLALLAERAGPQVTRAIRQASLSTGVDFSYLMEKAAAESNFDTDAKARTSSARGLYQFIERTWLGMVRDHGDKYGLSDYADKIDAKGRVADPKLRREILALRDDPEISAFMAAEFAQDNQAYLERHVRKEINSTDLYLAHFLGAGGAAGFLKAMQKSPLSAGADIFPEAAMANRNVFYNGKTGKARSLVEIYNLFDRKFGGSASGTDIASIKTPPLPPRMPDSRLALAQTEKAVAPSPFVASLRRAPTQDSGATLDQDFLWLMPPRFSGVGSGSRGQQAIGTGLLTSPAEVMILSQLDSALPLQDQGRT